MVSHTMQLLMKNAGRPVINVISRIKMLITEEKIKKEKEKIKEEKKSRIKMAVFSGSIRRAK